MDFDEVSKRQHLLESEYWSYDIGLILMKTESEEKSSEGD